MVSDAKQAQIVIYKGLNWDADEIAEQVGVGVTTVYSVLNDLEDYSKDPDVDPKRLYWSVVLADVFDGELRDAFAQIL